MRVHAVQLQRQVLYIGKPLAVIVLALLVHFVIWLKLHFTGLIYDILYIYVNVGYCILANVSYYLHATHQWGHTMILTFKELGINKEEFMMQPYYLCHSRIVNIACDYVMHHFFKGMKEEECIFNPRDAFVNFITQKVELETVKPLTH